MSTHPTNPQTMKDSLRSPSGSEEERSHQSDEEEQISAPGLIARKPESNQETHSGYQRKEFTYRSSQKIDPYQVNIGAKSTFSKVEENLKESKIGGLGLSVSEGSTSAVAKNQGPATSLEGGVRSSALNPTSSGPQNGTGTKKTTTTLWEELKDDTQSENLSEDEDRDAERKPSDQIQNSNQHEEEEQSDIDSDRIQHKNSKFMMIPEMEGSQKNKAQIEGARSVSGVNGIGGLIQAANIIEKANEPANAPPHRISKDSGHIPFAQQIVKSSKSGSIQQPQQHNQVSQQILDNQYEKSIRTAAFATNRIADSHSAQVVIARNQGLSSIQQSDGLGGKQSTSIVLASNKRTESGQVYQKQPPLEHHHSSELSGIQPQSHNPLYSNHHQPQQQHYSGASSVAAYNNSAPADYSKNFNNGRWNKTEHIRFLEALKLHGKNWKKVQQHVQSRSSTQARSHAQKFFVKLDRKGTDLQHFLDNLDMENIENLAADQLEFEDDDDEPPQQRPAGSNSGSHQNNPINHSQRRHTPPSSVENLRANVQSEQPRSKPGPVPKEEVGGRNSSTIQKSNEQNGRALLQPSVMQKISSTNSGVSQPEQKPAAQSLFATNRGGPQSVPSKPQNEQPAKSVNPPEDNHRESDQQERHENYGGSSQLPAANNNISQGTGGHQQNYPSERKHPPPLPQMSQYKPHPYQQYGMHSMAQMHQGPHPQPIQAYASYHQAAPPYMIPTYHPYAPMMPPPMVPSHHGGYIQMMDGSQVQAMIFNGAPPSSYNPYQAHMAQRQPIIYADFSQGNIPSAQMNYFPGPQAFVKSLQGAVPSDPHHEGSGHYYAMHPAHHPYGGQQYHGESSSANPQNHHHRNQESADRGGEGEGSQIHHQ